MIFSTQLLLSRLNQFVNTPYEQWPDDLLKSTGASRTQVSTGLVEAIYAGQPSKVFTVVKTSSGERTFTESPVNHL